ncbi:MAG: hypothetical protein ACMUHB_07260 [Thermoplasmatota archaeon]
MRPDDAEEHRALLQEIGEVHAAEKGSIKLTRLPEDFYERANSLIESTRARIENQKATSKGEFSEEYYRLMEEHRRAKEIMNSIYNMRERKIVLMAMNSARKITHSTDNMIHDEMDLFFDLKLEMEKIRGRVLKFGARSQEPIRAETGINTPLADYVESEPIAPPKEKGVPKTPSSEARSPAREDPPKEDREAPPEPAPTGRSDVPDGMVMVKALKDIATFMCPDSTSISMRKEDVALLPREVVDILVLNGSVEPIGGTR